MPSGWDRDGMGWHCHGMGSNCYKWTRTRKMFTQQFWLWVGPGSGQRQHNLLFVWLFARSLSDCLHPDLKSWGWRISSCFPIGAGQDELLLLLLLLCDRFSCHQLAGRRLRQLLDSALCKQLKIFSIYHCVFSSRTTWRRLSCRLVAFGSMIYLLCSHLSPWNATNLWGKHFALIWLS